MENIFNEVCGTTDTSSLTPIEIALGIDSNGMTTARRLYDFLELNPGNYARWCKTNILDNPFADDGTDYYSSLTKSEGKGNYAEDFKLTASFAKKLSMTQKNQKGEEARKYFVQIEDGAKRMAGMIKKTPLTEHPGEVANLIRLLSRIMEHQGSAPVKVAENAKLVCEQYGIALSKDFVMVPEYEQIRLPDLTA